MDEQLVKTILAHLRGGRTIEITPLTAGRGRDRVDCYVTVTGQRNDEGGDRERWRALIDGRRLDDDDFVQEIVNQLVRAQQAFDH